MGSRSDASPHHPARRTCHCQAQAVLNTTKEPPRRYTFKLFLDLAPARRGQTQLGIVSRSQGLRVFRGLPPAAQRTDSLLTIGNFDGVHRGHQRLLATLRQRAHAQGLASCVMTFEPHPREFFQPDQAPARLSTLRDKLDALAASGVDQVVVLRFNRALATQEPEDFVAHLLIDGLRARSVVIGDDFRFGAKRRGDVHLMREVGQRLVGPEFLVTDLPTEMLDGERISSSLVRQALQQGDFARAKELLGRPYALTGHVRHGRKLGRTLGFPTLNLTAPVRPAVHGIFAVRVHGLAAHPGDAPLPGVASLGSRPTIEQGGKPWLETHLFDWSGNAYGKLIRVEFVAKIRDEAKFDSLDALKAAIDDDAQQARIRLADRAN